MKQRLVGPSSLRVFRLLRALALGGLITAAACRPSEPSDVDPAPQQEPEPDAAEQSDAQQSPPPAESDQASSPELSEASERETARLMKFEEANGFEIYQQYCEVCHGTGGEGDGFNAFNLDPRPRSLVDQFAREQRSDEELTRAINLGGGARNKSPLMPHWGSTLSNRQVRYVISYIRLLQQRTPSVTADSGD